MGTRGTIANTTGVDGIAPRQGDDYSKGLSFERLNQIPAVLGNGFDAALGKGFLAGGLLISNGALSVKLAAGTTFFFGGVVHDLDADLIANTLIDNAANTVWATLKRTAADPALRSNKDAWAPALKATSTGAAPTTDADAPAASWWAVATVTVTSGVAGTFDNAPPGKYAALLARLPAVPEAVPLGITAQVPVGTQAQRFRRFTARGTGTRLQVRGHFRVRA